MRRWIPFLVFALFSSCGINSIVKTYDESWLLDLEDELPDLGNGSYSGLSELSDGSILVLHESSAGGSNDVELIKIDPDGALVNSVPVPDQGYNYDINNSAGAELIYFQGSGSNFFGDNAFLSISNDLTWNRGPADLSEQFSQLAPLQSHLSSSSFYLAGLSRDQSMSELLRISFDGTTTWQFDFELSLPLSILEGTNRDLFVLLDQRDVEQVLVNISDDGQEKWSRTLTGPNGMITGMNEADLIFGSPSNTTTVVGAGTDEKLSFALVDPRGDLIFQRTLPRFAAVQFQDFMVTQDGAFMFALMGDQPLSAPMYIILKLDHRGDISWEGRFPLDVVVDVELIELKNKEVMILTEDGSLQQIIPG